MKYKVGDWVNFEYFGHALQGFIVDISIFRGMYCVAVPKHLVNKWVYEDRIVKADVDLDEDDLLQLVDIALDLGDKEWFDSLTQQLPLRNF